MAPIQRDGFEYEFDVFAEMDMDNNLIISKTRCTKLGEKGLFEKPTGVEIATILMEWVEGEQAPPPPAPPHWADDKEQVAVLWATVYDKLAIDNKAFMELAGISDLHEWNGSGKELYAEVKKKLEAKLLAEDQE